VSEIADFLRARIAERRALAEAASPGPWEGVVDRHQRGVVEASVWSDELGYYITEKISSGERHGADAHHIAANDPVTVIADCDAKLALIEELDYEPAVTEGESDADLHARRAHPAWEYATTEGPRKQWYGADVPPANEDGDPDPTWERNVDAGRDGWERWDYTEEAYWRRPRPDGPRKPYIPLELRILAQPFAGHADHKGEEWAP
jgi:hypothetical protein